MKSDCYPQAAQQEAATAPVQDAGDQRSSLWGLWACLITRSASAQEAAGVPVLPVLNTSRGLGWGQGEQHMESWSSWTSVDCHNERWREPIWYCFHVPPLSLWGNCPRAWLETWGWRVNDKDSCYRWPICSSVSFPAVFLVSKGCGHLNLVQGHSRGRISEGLKHGLRALTLKAL